MTYFRKRPNGWEYRISYKDDFGKYKQKSKSGFKTKSEASHAANEAELLLSKNILSDQTILLSDFFENWAEIHKKPHISEVTWQKYEQTKRHIDIFFRNKRVCDITPTLYQEVLNDFGQKYSQETIENFHFHIKSAMKIAVREKIIDENFCEFAIAKSQKEKRPISEKFLEENEYLNLIELTKEKINFKSYFAIYLISVTGLRFAEALGLTWNDVDFDNGLFDINKTWNYALTHDWAETKNKSSIRKIPVSKDTLNLLKDYKENIWQENQYNRIICDISNAAVNNTLKKLVGRKVHVHSLRHTYASFLIAQGIDLISISKLLGHENLNITLSVYAHQLEKLETKNHENVRNIFDNL